MKTKTWLIALLFLAAIVLSACTMGITTKVNADGSGELGFVYKFTKDELKSLTDMGASADTICTDVSSEGGVGGDVELKQEQHGDETWCVGSQSFATLDELRTELGGEGFALNTLEIEGEKFTFDADVDMSSAGADTSGIPFEIEIQYELTAPGTVSNHNGDQKDGKTVIWNLSLTGSRNLHLESSTKVAKPTSTPKPTKVSSTTDKSGGDEAGTAKYTTQINTDESWNLTVEAGEKIIESGSGGTIEEECANLNDMLSQQEVEDEGYTSSAKLDNRGGEKVCVVEFSAKSLDKLSDIYSSFSSSDVNRLEIVDNTLYYDVSIISSESDQDVDITWKVVMPGKVGENNADKSSGCTLTWNLNSGADRTLTAESSTEGGCGSDIMGTAKKYWWVAVIMVCCCLLIIIVGVVVVFMVTRRKKPAGRM